MTYLRLQLEAVRRALAAAENRKPAKPHPSPRGQATPGTTLGPAPPRSERAPTGFMIEQRRTADGQEAAVHLDDCRMSTYLTHSVGAQEARLALTDAQMEACPFCRPDTELGILE
jgi:hypothetical protein